MKKISVCFLPRYHENGSSSRYRYYNYKGFLSEDIEMSFFPLLPYEYVDNLYKGIKNKKTDIIVSYLKRILFLVKKKNKYDLFIIEKELFPFIPFFIEKILLKNKKYSIDFDDNAKTKYQKNYILNRLYGNKIDKLVADAEFITVGNNWFLNDLRNDCTVFLPTVVDYEKYCLKEEKSKNFQIVWIGSPSTSKYLNIIEEPLNILISSGLEFNLLIIGAGNFKFQNSLFDYQIVEWSEKTEASLIAQSHIGIMPLDTTDWDEGKCGFKLIQYLAAGIPVIASNTKANRDIISNGEIGFIANTNEDWIKYIKFYYDKQSDIDDFSKSAREIVKNRYSYQSTGKIYSDLIKERCD